MTIFFSEGHLFSSVLFFLFNEQQCQVRDTGERGPGGRSENIVTGWFGLVGINNLIRKPDQIHHYIHAI